MNLSALHIEGTEKTAVNPNFRTILLSGFCIPKMVLKRDADEKKKKIVFGQV